MPHVYEVGELTRAVRDTLEGEFPFVWVRGQVSNLARPASGHIYFSLKDREAVLAVVWFKGAQPVLGAMQERVDLETGEVLSVAATDFLADGSLVLVAGRLTVYPAQGRYQLVAELVQEEGVGELAKRFEALRAALADRGWFDAARKRPLPENPARVALVTSATGAAVQDFIRLAQTRGLDRELRVYPTQVSGELAAPQVAAAIAKAARDGFAQVVVVLRGGGSIEDLWAFNTVEVAQAIYDCPIPVISAVGHEVDTTIADMVADVRAATPSHAAELLWVRREHFVQAVDELDMELFRVIGRSLEARAQSLDRAAKTLSLLSPQARLTRAQNQLESGAQRLVRTIERLLEASDARLSSVRQRLRRFADSDFLDRRGNRLARARKEMCIAAARLLERGQTRLDAADNRLKHQAAWLVDNAESRLREALLRLQAVDPQAPLRLGFSLVSLESDGSLVRDAAQLVAGQRLRIQAAKGEAVAVVAAIVSKASRS